MIVGETFAWLHLPKTGGTSTANLFRSLGLPGISVDDDNTDNKHDSAAERRYSTNTWKEPCNIYLTARRLPLWLLSDWHHKKVLIGIDIPFEPVKSGLFFSLRLGGTWTAADYWLNYFEAFSCSDFIRLENLDEDANRLIHPHLPEGTPMLNFPARNANRYSRHLGDFFSHRDLSRVYANNPLWSAWEEQVYGSRTQLPLPEQLRSLRRRLR